MNIICRNVLQYNREGKLFFDLRKSGKGGRNHEADPYFGYARQDRRVANGEPVGGRVAADLLSTGLGGVVAVDLHKPTLDGFFALPVEHLSATELLAKALKKGGLVLISAIR